MVAFPSSLPSPSPPPAFLFCSTHDVRSERETRKREVGLVPPGEFSSFRSHHQHFPFMGSPDRPTPPFFAFSLSFLQYTGRAFAFGLGGSWWAGGVGGLLEFIGRTNNSIRAPPTIFLFSPSLFPRHFLLFPFSFSPPFPSTAFGGTERKSRKGETGGNGLRRSSSPTPLFCATSFLFLVVCLRRTPLPPPSRHTRAKKGHLCLFRACGQKWAHPEMKRARRARREKRVEEERETAVIDVKGRLFFPFKKHRTSLVTSIPFFSVFRQPSPDRVQRSVLGADRRPLEPPHRSG